MFGHRHQRAAAERREADDARLRAYDALMAHQRKAVPELRAYLKAQGIPDSEINAVLAKQVPASYSVSITPYRKKKVDDPMGRPWGYWTEVKQTPFTEIWTNPSGPHASDEWHSGEMKYVATSKVPASYKSQVDPGGLSSLLSRIGWEPSEASRFSQSLTPLGEFQYTPKQKSERHPLPGMVVNAVPTLAALATLPFTGGATLPAVLTGATVGAAQHRGEEHGGALKGGLMGGLQGLGAAQMGPSIGSAGKEAAHSLMGTTASHAAASVPSAASLPLTESLPSGAAMVSESAIPGITGSALPKSTLDYLASSALHTLPSGAVTVQPESLATHTLPSGAVTGVSLPASSGLPHVSGLMSFLKEQVAPSLVKHGLGLYGAHRGAREAGGTYEESESHPHYGEQVNPEFEPLTDEMAPEALRLNLLRQDPLAAYYGHLKEFGVHKPHKSNSPFPRFRKEQEEKRKRFERGGYVKGGATKGSDSGRSDKIKVSMKEGTYVFNAMDNALLGEGNPEHGQKIVKDMEKKLIKKYETKYKHSPITKDWSESKKVKALLSPSEYQLDPRAVAALGGGSNTKGAKIIDKGRRLLRKQKGVKDILPPKSKPIEHYFRGK